MGVTVRTPEIEQAIFAGLSEGTPLTVICREQGIGYSTVMDWQKQDKAFAGDIACARDEGWDKIASRVRQTARGQADSTSDVQRDKLIIETDLKLLAKWDKRYGDKTLLGSDPENPLPQGFTVKLIKGPEGEPDAG